MPWIPDDKKAAIHLIRQDYALAVSYAKEFPDDPESQRRLNEVVQRRARAIRMAHTEAKIPYRALSGLFRCPRQVVRDALNEGEQE